MSYSENHAHQRGKQYAETPYLVYAMMQYMNARADITSNSKEIVSQTLAGMTFFTADMAMSF